tara:strand:- start:324 stop:650 length:327 start_codon:yes stop_codon:yes gene_type:complete
MSVHEKHDECISHWPVVKGINQKGTWPQETALPSLTGALPRSQLRQRGHEQRLAPATQANQKHYSESKANDTLLHTVLKPVYISSLELGKQQSLEQADFVMVKDKIAS